VERIILIEKSNRKEISIAELTELKTQALDSKNGLSLVMMKELSEQEGCQVYRLLKKFLG